MSSSLQASTPSVLLIAIDETVETAQQVIAYAENLARCYSQPQIHIVYVIEPIAATAAVAGFTPPAMFPSFWQDVEPARNYLQQHVETTSKSTLLPVTGHLIVGIPWQEIVQLAVHLGADTVLVGSHSSSGLARLLLGSVSEAVVRKAPCPVCVVRPKQVEASNVPEIEPPCPDCLVTQRASKGASLWCSRHTEHHPHAHTYHHNGETFGMGSQTFRSAQ